MDLTFSDAERYFREEVREWLGRKVPREPCPPVGPDHRAFMLEWQRTQFEDGWAGVSWPSEYGGRDLSLIEQLIWFEEYARAGAPWVGCLFVGLNHAGPTLLAKGSAEQKAVYLPPILRGDVVWCQGFSEPGAGSDLASVQTSGEIDGDAIVVTGSKIWTSYAHLADHQELLVRTNPGKGRHGGLTWMIADMRAPGVEIRPIQDVTGANHFAQVFYDRVRIPLANVVGGVGNGWATALATLSFERGTAFTSQQIMLAQTVNDLIEHARDLKRADGEMAAALAGLRAETAALRAMTYLGVSRGLRQATPGPEGTMLALAFAELSQKVASVAMRLLGARALMRPGGRADWATEYLGALRNTIGGGTSEIRRNIIGERVLGLPR